MSESFRSLEEIEEQEGIAAWALGLQRETLVANVVSLARALISSGKARRGIDSPLPQGTWSTVRGAM